MDVNPSYKQTEAGVIPENWTLKELGEVCRFSQGVQIDLEKQSTYQKEGFIRFLRIENYTQGSNDFRYTPKHLCWNKVIDEQDIVVVRYGATAGFIGRGLKGALANNLFKIEPISFNLAKDFLYIYLNSEKAFNYFQSSMFGGAMPALSFKVVKTLQISLPPLPEQRAITETLSDVDALISALDQLIVKKRDLKLAAMQQLLTGQKRLLGFHDEWEIKRLGEIGDITSAGVDKKSRPGEVPVRLVNYLDVYQKDFIYSDDLNHWVTAPPHQARRCGVQKGDVFFTPSSETRDDIGMAAVAMEDIPDAAYSYHVVRLRLKEGWNLPFRTYARAGHF